MSRIDHDDNDGGDDDKNNVCDAIFYASQLALARNYRIEPVVSNLDSVSRPNMQVNIPAFDLNEFLAKDAEDRANYFIYKGSLPYPPCTAGVEWTVMATPSTVGEIQVWHATVGKSRINNVNNMLSIPSFHKFSIFYTLFNFILYEILTTNLS